MADLAIGISKTAAYEGNGMVESVAMAGEGKASSSSWVIEMDKMLVDTNQSVEMARWNKTSIYQVPEYIKRMTNSMAYGPRLVSLGPFHHGECSLLPMEEHKRRAVLHRGKRSGKPLAEFIAAIEEVADELEDVYDNLDEEWRGANRGRFVEMMVTDGCFLLEFMMDQALKDYAPNDPIFSDHSHFILWPIILGDMVSMENQLPLLVLRRLVVVELGESPSAEYMNKLVLHGQGRRPVEGFDFNKMGLHPLDVYHRSFCGSLSESEASGKLEPRMPSATELSEAGIDFKKSNIESIGAIYFEKGTLSMPVFSAHDSSERMFLNMMVFEWLHPDAGNELISYISFVDKIINSERDVALLRSKGVIKNLMNSDQSVVELFGTLTKLSRMKHTSRLNGVHRMVNAHCSKRRNKWRAYFVQTYWSNPWVFFSLVSAVIVLVATVLQTFYTVVPFYTKR